MAWIYLAESEESVWPCHRGLDHSPTVKTTDTLELFYCLGCGGINLRPPQYGTTLPLSYRSCCPDRKLTSSTADSHARISVLRELEQAWMANEADSFSSYSGSFATWSLGLYSWKTFQQSFIEGLDTFSGPWPAWGTMQGGLVFQQAKLEPFILENDGTYLPTPTASDYGRNVGRKSDGLTPSGRDRWSLTVLAKRGELPGHPKGVLNPEWTELAMGYPIGWTGTEPWVTPFIQKQRGKLSCA
jgi:hypothetical protein